MFRLLVMRLCVCVHLQACLNTGVAELNKEKTEETFKPQKENPHRVFSLDLVPGAWEDLFCTLKMNCLEEKQQPFACLFNLY